MGICPKEEIMAYIIGLITSEEEQEKYSVQNR